MKKRLLLTLLPLAFLVAACSGANKPASSSKKSGGSSAGEDADISEPTGDDSSEEGDTSETPEDARASDTPVASGASLKIGDYYYEMDEQDPDAGMDASYNLKNIETVTGQKIQIYVDGEAVEAWAQADAEHSTYPNYDERPTSTKFAEFTVTEGAVGDAYVHKTSTGDYTFWLTPTNDGAGGSSGGGGGSSEGDADAPTSGFAVKVTSGSTVTYYVANDTGEEVYGKHKYLAAGVELAANDQIQMYNGSTGTAFNCVEGELYTSSGIGGNFERAADYVLCKVAGTYNIEIQTKFNADTFYIYE